MLHSKRISVKIVVAALGILATGVPILTFNAWLKKQGDDEITVLADWALASAEMQLGQTVAALYGLSLFGVNSCLPANLDAMHQAVLRTGPVKELMLVAADGQIVCTDSGALGRYEVLSSSPTASADIMLDVVRFSGRDDRFLRVRKLAEPDRPALAALTSAALLLPQARMPGGRMPGDIRLAMADGTLIGGTNGTTEPAVAQDELSHPLADAPGSRGARRGGRTAARHDAGLQRCAAAFRRRADPQ